MKTVSAVFSYLLLVAAFAMSAWGIVGFLEYSSGNAVVVPLQNPNFPKGTQFIHWFLITASGLTYLVGYFRRWKYTPNVMVVLYACLATMCFIQTFDFMTRPNRYMSFIIECINYTVVSLYLFLSARMQEHFGRSV